MVDCAGLSRGQIAKQGRTRATLVTTERIPGFATCSTIVLYAGWVYLTTALASVAPLAGTSATGTGSVSENTAEMSHTGAKFGISMSVVAHRALRFMLGMTAEKGFIPSTTLVCSYRWVVMDLTRAVAAMLLSYVCISWPVAA